MRRIVLASLAVVFCLCTSLFASSVFAVTKNSLEYNVKGSEWLDQGKVLSFDGKKDQKSIMGKFYLLESGTLTFDFFNAKGKLVLTHTKVVKSNPQKEPFFTYNFDLDQDMKNGYLKQEGYKVKITTSGNTSTWGWLNY